MAKTGKNIAKEAYNKDNEVVLSKGLAKAVTKKVMGEYNDNTKNKRYSIIRSRNKKLNEQRKKIATTLDYDFMDVGFEDQMKEYGFKRKDSE